jgi:PAS domain S-box-containing protein
VLSLRHKIILGFFVIVALAGLVLGLSYPKITEIRAFNRQILPTVNETAQMSRQIQNIKYFNDVLEDYLLVGTEEQKGLLKTNLRAIREEVNQHIFPSVFVSDEQEIKSFLRELDQKVSRLIREKEAQGSPRVINRLVFETFRLMDNLQTSLRDHVDHRVSELRDKVVAQNTLLEKARDYFLGILFVLVAVSLAMAMFLSRVIISQLRKLQQAMQHIMRGNMDEEIPVRSTDEVGQLAQTFEAMRVHLKNMTVSRDDLACQIEQRKKAEAQLIQNEEQIKAVLENTPDAIRVIDKQCNVIRVNSKMEKLTGVSAQQQAARKCYEVFPSQFCRTDRCLLKQTVEGQTPLPVRITKKDAQGRERFIEIVSNPLFVKGQIIGSVESYRDVTHLRQEEEKLKAAYQESKDALMISESLREDLQLEQEKTMATQQELQRANAELEKNERSLRNILFDMRETNQKLKATQAQLVQSEKLASLGQLSAGVAHEINNPLGFISNNIHILEQYIDAYAQLLKSVEGLKKAAAAKGDADIAKHLEQIQQLETALNIDFIKEDIWELVEQSKAGVERISKIVQDLRTFSRKDEDQMELCNIEDILEGVLTIVWNEIKYNAELKKAYGHVPLVRCNPQKLGQVFINILVNAAQAIPDKGLIEIKTYLLASGQQVCVEIADTGQGMPPEVADKIFDPFYTTKPVGKGTGLGLSVGYDIIKQHNGDIRVESTEGQGTRFYIQLPQGSQKKTEKESAAK